MHIISCHKQPVKKWTSFVIWGDDGIPRFCPLQSGKKSLYPFCTWDRKTDAVEYVISHIAKVQKDNKAWAKSQLNYPLWKGHEELIDNHIFFLNTRYQELIMPFPNSLLHIYLDPPESNVCPEGTYPTFGFSVFYFKKLTFHPDTGELLTEIKPLKDLYNVHHNRTQQTT